MKPIDSARKPEEQARARDQDADERSPRANDLPHAYRKMSAEKCLKLASDQGNRLNLGLGGRFLELVDW